MSEETYEGRRLDISMTELTDAILSVPVTSTKFNLSCIPDGIKHVPGFTGEESGVMELDAVLKTDAVIGQG
jgi:hypothetical protein